MDNEENTLDEINFDLKKKKKSKKRTNDDVLTEVNENQPIDDVTMKDDDFTYEFLLERAFDMIDPDRRCVRQMRVILSPPDIGRIGTRRTIFKNFGATCKTLNRSEKVLMEFFVVELGTTASIDSNHALIIKGRLTQKQIENILRSFIREYVTCKTCHSPDTLMKKVERLTMIECNTCRSQYSVSNIRAGVNHQ